MQIPIETNRDDKIFQHYMYGSYSSRTRMPRCTKTDLPSLTLTHSVYMYTKNI